MSRHMAVCEFLVVYNIMVGGASAEQASERKSP